MIRLKKGHSLSEHSQPFKIRKIRVKEGGYMPSIKIAVNAAIAFLKGANMIIPYVIIVLELIEKYL